MTIGTELDENALEQRIETFRKEMDGIVDDKTFDWLKKNGFFTQTASAGHHGAYEGGLFDHSLAVMKNLVSLTEKLGLVWDREESPKIVGMFHDICKIDQYVKTNAGKYMFVRNTPLKGHGDKSVVITRRLMDITVEEAMCIEYHMGAFTDSKFWSRYTEAVQRYPNVLWTHTADMMASNIDNV